MTTKQTIQTTVTDTNGRLQGAMDIQVEFSDFVPNLIIHDGKTFFATGKEGVKHEDWQRRDRSGKRRRQGTHLDCTRRIAHLGGLNATQND